MLQCVSWGDPVLGVHFEHFLQQAQSFRGHLRRQEFERLLFPFGEPGGEVLQLLNLRPFCFSGCAHELKHLEDLFDLMGAAHKKRALEVQLGKNTTNSPDIDGITVVTHPQHDFGGSIPECLDFAG